MDWLAWVPVVVVDRPELERLVGSVTPLEFVALELEASTLSHVAESLGKSKGNIFFTRSLLTYSLPEEHWLADIAAELLIGIAQVVAVVAESASS